ncbi:unnamed protein product [Parajaminaea phylloscopi]
MGGFACNPATYHPLASINSTRRRTMSWFGGASKGPTMVSAALTRPGTRRAVTSSVFLATFVGSILTVAASSWLLPCPARSSGKGVLSQEEAPKESHGPQQRSLATLSGRKGWIQVDDEHR